VACYNQNWIAILVDIDELNFNFSFHKEPVWMVVFSVGPLAIGILIYLVILIFVKSRSLNP